MTKNTNAPFPLTDPYTASSLLQKAIRRGEPDLAIESAHLLLRHRGRHVWRRLLIVAFEDVGLGNTEAVELTTEFAEAHLNKRIDCLSDGLETVVRSLAGSPKSRATDHLACGAAHHYSTLSLAQRSELADLGSVLHVAGDPGRSLIERAAALSDTQGRTPAATKQLLIERMVALESLLPKEAGCLVDLAIRAYKLLNGSFVLTLPLLQSAIAENDRNTGIEEACFPSTEWIGRLPTYVFDKHTSVGKRALRRFAHENSAVAAELDTYVSPQCQVDAVCMAAFYVDAVPLDRKLEWPGAEELERAGLRADMRNAGCPPCGIDPLMTTVAKNLDHLNALRVALSGWRED